MCIRDRQGPPQGSYRGGGIVDYARRYHEGGGVGGPDEVRRRREAHLKLYGDDPSKHIHQSMAADPAVPQPVPGSLQQGSGVQLSDYRRALGEMPGYDPALIAELERAQALERELYPDAVSKWDPRRLMGRTTTGEQRAIIESGLNSPDEDVKQLAEERMRGVLEAEGGLQISPSGDLNIEGIRAGYAAMEQQRKQADEAERLRQILSPGTLPSLLRPEDMLSRNMGGQNSIAVGPVPAGDPRPGGQMALERLQQLRSGLPEETSDKREIPWLEVVKAGLNIAAGQSDDPIQNIAGGMGTAIEDYESRAIQERSLASEGELSAAQAALFRAQAGSWGEGGSANEARRFKMLSDLAERITGDPSLINDPRVLREYNTYVRGSTGDLSGANLITGRMGGASMNAAGGMRAY